MNKPEVKDLFPMHWHTCEVCQESMKHYNVNGCNAPELILCETCRNPEPQDNED